MKIGFAPFALSALRTPILRSESLSKGRSWFDKLTTNDTAYLFSFIVVPMVIGMNDSALDTKPTPGTFWILVPTSYGKKTHFRHHGPFYVRLTRILSRGLAVDRRIINLFRKPGKPFLIGGSSAFST